MALVVDASVSVAWFVGSQASVYSSRVRRLARTRRVHVPPLWPLEFANALWQLERRRLLTPSAVDTIVDLADDFPWVLHNEVKSKAHYLSLARRFNLSIYDAAYLDLAMELKLPLACTDGPLKRALPKAGVRPA